MQYALREKIFKRAFLRDYANFLEIIFSIILPSDEAEAELIKLALCIDFYECIMICNMFV